MNKRGLPRICIDLKAAYEAVLASRQRTRDHHVLIFVLSESQGVFDSRLGLCTELMHLQCSLKLPFLSFRVWVCLLLLRESRPYYDNQL